MRLEWPTAIYTSALEFRLHLHARASTGRMHVQRLGPAPRENWQPSISVVMLPKGHLVCWLLRYPSVVHAQLHTTYPQSAPHPCLAATGAQPLSPRPASPRSC